MTLQNSRSCVTFQIRSKKGSRHYSKVVSLLGKREKECVFFSNENREDTFVPRHSEETARQWETRYAYVRSE